MSDMRVGGGLVSLAAIPMSMMFDQDYCACTWASSHPWCHWKYPKIQQG